jgi:hypothetical protein
MRTPLLCLSLLLLGLACAGTGAPDPVPAEPAPEVPAAAPRVLPEGEIEPVSLVTLSGGERCRVELAGAGAGGVEERELGTLPGPCPTRAMVAYKSGAVVISDEAGVLTELGAKKGPPALPAAPGALAFDGDGKLHACGPTEVVGEEKDGKYVAEYKGQRLEADKPAIADGARVHVRWEQEQGRWVEKGAELVYHLVFPGPPDCLSVDGFPELEPYGDDPGFFTSDGPWWMATGWTSALPEDKTALAALSEGDWYVDDSRTIASKGQPDGGPYALWLADAWKMVHPTDDARGLWVFPDFVGIRDADGGFRLISRRDGAETFAQADETLTWPWPEAALPEAAEPSEPGEPGEPGEEPAGGQYGGERGKKGKGKKAP